MKKIALLFVAAAMLSLTGCGYQLGAPKPHELANVKKLAVPTFKNDTLEPRIEVMVTDALIKELQVNGTYKIVPVSEADAVLRGTITGITRRQFRADLNNNLRSTELSSGLVVRYKIEGPDGAALKSGQARESTEVVLDPNFQVTEAQALAVVAQKLSGSIASDITQGW